MSVWKKSWIWLIAAALICLLSFYIGRETAPSGETYGQNEIITAVTEENGNEEEVSLGAFDITSHHRSLAAENEKGYAVLDAGRGNPNWINTITRKAYTRLMDFAVSECERTYEEENMGGQAEKEGIYDRFTAAMDPSSEADAFLLAAADYCIKNLGMEPDGLIKEFADGIVGDYYPSPSRCLSNTEVILNAYLESVLYDGESLKDSTLVFPTEGGSAAICYIFDSLYHNRVLARGDRIAIATPIFTPYLQIPDIDRYQLITVNVESTEEDHWMISEEEIEKLKDPEIKAFFLVNPSNPASHALSKECLEQLKEVIRVNPDLIIITDDVYGTFTDGFQSIYAVLPENTILVYSFSKLYGATGWRIGMAVMNENNVVDRLISELPEEVKAVLDKEYEIVSEDPRSFPFAERIVADSRSIGLYHTSGLGTPQQIFMDLLALSHLTAAGEDPYIALANDVIQSRYHILMQAFHLPEDNMPENARYYALLDLEDIWLQAHGEEFTAWMDESVGCLSFLERLASEYGVVLMYGPGFGAPENTARISLANLDEESYAGIAERVYALLDEYYAEYSAGETQAD